MKNILLLIFIVIVLVSCRKTPGKIYPYYEIVTIRYVPDSVHSEYSQWIQESLSNYYSNSEDSDVYRIQNVANDLFQIKVRGLVKNFDNISYNSFYIPPEHMSMEEVLIFNQLNNL